MLNLMFKSLIIGTGLAILLLFSAASWSLDWNEWSAMGKQTVDTKAYKISTSGTDLRVYEYKALSGKICTVIVSSKKGMSQSCDWPPECK